MKKILITGGAGYIGSHTCKELAQQGYSLYVFDNLSTGHRDLVQWSEFIQGDITDYKALLNCMQTFQPDGVIHFAALSQVGESVTNPAKYYHNNIYGTLNILKTMQECAVKNIVVSSTCAVYGQPSHIPIAETASIAPISPYGFTKQAMEQMLMDFEKAYGFNWMALRYFNAAGCDFDKETGERHTPESHLIPRAILAILGKVPPLHIFGTDYDTPDGTCIRDYVHVKDLAIAHQKAIEYLFEGKKSQAVNIGTGQGFSVKEILDGFKNHLGQEVPHVLKERRAGDPARLIADASKALATLNWKAEHSSLKEILTSAWHWHNKDTIAHQQE